MRNVLLVTGGSRGIGAATAHLAATQGYAVCFSYVQNATAAEAVVAAITTAGGEAQAVQADVGVEADVLCLFTSVWTAPSAPSPRLSTTLAFWTNRRASST